jgi:hypothetical protein
MLAVFRQPAFANSPEIHGIKPHLEAQRGVEGDAPGASVWRRVGQQLAWLWLRHQPQSALALWFKERVKRNGGMKNTIIVARPQASSGAAEIRHRRRLQGGSPDQDRLTTSAKRIRYLRIRVGEPRSPWPEMPLGGMVSFALAPAAACGMLVQPSRAATG